jgi:hypothetical protein
MISRAVSAPLLLAASVGVPYVASNTMEWTQQLRSGPAPVTAPATAPPAEAAATQPAATATPPVALPAAAPPLTFPPPQGPGANLFPTAAPLEGMPTHSIADVLRFDVSRDWVYQQWPRKSTALAELDLYGVRVPLVTGTQLHDLAGSLTYYFGLDGRVKRLTFTGRTGDTTQLAAIAHQRFGLQALATPIAGEQLLQYRNGDDVISELRTRPAPVLWASTPHDSFAVELVLQDPATAKPLPPRIDLPAEVAGTPSQPATAFGSPAAAPAPSAAPATNAAAPPPPPAAEPAEPLGWKAFFPRSRLPKAQVNQLDKANLYQ